MCDYCKGDCCAFFNLVRLAYGGESLKKSLTNFPREQEAENELTAEKETLAQNGGPREKTN